MIALIDADSLIYSCSYKRTPDESIENYHQRIDDIVETTEANKYALFLTIGKTFRHKVINSYKSNRPRDWKTPVFYYLKHYILSQSGANYQEGVEADDLVSYWSRQLENAIVCSPDKDVIYSNKKCYNYNKNEIIVNSEEQIDKFFWKQMLMGDSSDNIAGIPGTGDKISDRILKKVETSLKLGKSDLNYRHIVLDKYIEHYGLSQGIHKFNINFRQLYLLKTDNDFINNYFSIPDLKVMERNELQTL